MTPREIIAEAWAISKREKSLKRWGFFASFFETLLNIKLIGYQLYFLWAYLGGHQVGLLDDFIWLHANVAFWVFITVLIGFGLLLLIEFVMPHLSGGAIVGLAAKSYAGEKTDGGLVLALYNFFPLFVLHESLVLSSWSLLVSIISLVLRYVDNDMRYVMIGFALFFWVVSNILQFFFSFAPPAIVIHRQGVFRAMGLSLKLIISYLGQVMFLLLLLFVITLRVLFNAIIVLVIPAIAIGIGLLLAMIFSPFVSYLIASILGVGLLLVASYFFGYLHVFKESVWAITYMEFCKRKDLLVVQEGSKAPNIIPSHAH